MRRENSCRMHLGNVSRGGSLATIALAAGLLAIVHAAWPAMPIAMLLGLAALIVGVGALATASVQSNVRNVAIIGVCAGLIGFGVANVREAGGQGGWNREWQSAGAGGDTQRAGCRRSRTDQKPPFAMRLTRCAPNRRTRPALAEARKKAMQVRCAANMRQIAQALMVYSQDNRDMMPDDLMLLEKLGLVRAKQFQSPLDSDESNVCDYYYVPYKRYRSGSKNWLLLWTDPAYTDGEGANVVYVDNHAEFLKADEFKRAMDRFVREYKKANRGEAPPVVEPK